jgi:glycosyltransferase involved in cell wall biosynthesis
MNTVCDRKVSIIIPAYNEADAIGDVLDKLQVPAKEHGWEVVVVNDGSTDDTENIAELRGVRVITHERNKGYGASLKTAVRSVDSNVVVFMDSDGQHKPDDIMGLLKHIEDYDAVIGARTAQSHTDIGRKPGKKVLGLFANFLAKEEIPDVNSGFRAFRRDILLRYLHLMPDSFSFSTTSTFAMLKGGHRMKWVPIVTEKRIGKSTVRQLKHGSETLMLMLRLIVLFDPLRVFLPISGLLMFLAILMTALNLLFYRMAIPASAVLFAVSAVIIFMLGLVTDQVSAIRREQHRRF